MTLTELVHTVPSPREGGQEPCCRYVLVSGIFSDLSHFHPRDRSFHDRLALNAAQLIRETLPHIEGGHFRVTIAVLWKHVDDVSFFEEMAPENQMRLVRRLAAGWGADEPSVMVFATDLGHRPGSQWCQMDLVGFERSIGWYN